MKENQNQIEISIFGFGPVGMLDRHEDIHDLP
jgi:hypothetical protein